MSVTTCGGTSAGSADQFGVDVNTAAIRSATELPSPLDDARGDPELVEGSNARVPVNISYRTAPNAHTSVRLSTAFPRACSGDMYAAVPRITPARDMAGDAIVGEFIAWTVTSMPLDSAPFSRAFARPKSSTFTAPSSRTLMLAGFRS